MESKRPRMDRADRAKQFMPFDALKGLREALAEKERELEMVSRKELTEEVKAELDRKINALHSGETVSVRYFQQGQYVQLTGRVTRVSANRREIRILDAGLEEKKIRTEDILELYPENC